MRDPEKISARRRSLLGEREGSFAEAKFLRMSPMKVRRVIDLVRGKDVNTALAILRFAPQAAAEPAYKTLASAVANASQQEGLEADDLFVSAIFADEGVTLRRIRPRAKGSASRILKRGAHLTVVVEPKPEPKAKSAVAATAAKKATAAKAAPAAKTADKSAKAAGTPAASVVKKVAEAVVKPVKKASASKETETEVTKKATRAAAAVESTDSADKEA